MFFMVVDNNRMFESIFSFYAYVESQSCRIPQIAIFSLSRFDSIGVVALNQRIMWFDDDNNCILSSKISVFIQQKKKDSVWVEHEKKTHTRITF